jgi:hypothetical protein
MITELPKHDLTEVIYSITVGDILDIAEQWEEELSDDELAHVIHYIQNMDFGDMAETIRLMIEEVKQ